MSQAGSLTSSTPHPRRNVEGLFSLFEDNTISPITQPNPVTKPPNQLQPKSRLVRPSTQARKKVSPKKTKHVPKQKESTSKAVLKELGVTGASVRNMLSSTRNLYHLYPEPIILDSDEEEELFTSRNVPKKTSEKNTPRKNRSEKNTPRKNRSEKNTPRKNRSKKMEIVEDSENNIKSARIKSTKSGVPRQHLSAPKASKQSPSVVILDNDDSLMSVNLPPSNLSDSMKIKHLNIPTMINAIKEDAIKWTPRRSKNVKTKVGNCNDVESDNCNDSESDCENDEKLCGKPTNQLTCTKELLPRKAKNKSVPQPSLENSKTEHLGNNFPEECCSRFENVVFKPNKNCGGIVANCLKTDKLNFGYLEIEKDKVFQSRQSADITFVVLEGQVEATLQDATQTLVPGDMLHVNSESKYHFVNHGPDHARLLFVRQRS